MELEPCQDFKRKRLSANTSAHLNFNPPTLPSSQHVSNIAHHQLTTIAKEDTDRSVPTSYGHWRPVE
jgi:hypothetical protein